MSYQNQAKSFLSTIDQVSSLVEGFTDRAVDLDNY